MDLHERGQTDATRQKKNEEEGEVEYRSLKLDVNSEAGEQQMREKDRVSGVRCQSGGYEQEHTHKRKKQANKQARNARKQKVRKVGRSIEYLNGPWSWSVVVVSVCLCVCVLLIGCCWWLVVGCWR